MLSGIEIFIFFVSDHLKSITSTPKTPHPHNVHLTLCVEKSICESSLKLAYVVLHMAVKDFFEIHF